MFLDTLQLAEILAGGVIPPPVPFCTRVSARLKSAVLVVTSTTVYVHVLRAGSDPAFVRKHHANNKTAQKPLI